MLRQTRASAAKLKLIMTAVHGQGYDPVYTHPVIKAETFRTNHPVDPKMTPPVHYHNMYDPLVMQNALDPLIVSEQMTELTLDSIKQAPHALVLLCLSAMLIAFCWGWVVLNAVLDEANKEGADANAGDDPDDPDEDVATK